MDLPINNNSQLFFTTHETGLLDLDIFRRDQIWFTELTPKERSTVLYSLAELKNVRKDEKYSKGQEDTEPYQCLMSILQKF